MRFSLKLFVTSIVLFAFFLNSINVSFSDTTSIPTSKFENSNIACSVFIPEAYGSIDQSHIDGKSQVILIKDVHCQYEAQKNISKILETLIRDYKVDLVCVEGAEGLVDTSAFSAYPDSKMREKVADKYLKNGILSASEALSIAKAKDSPFTIYGVEETRLYLENFTGFRNTIKNKSETKRFIEIISSVIHLLKSKIFNKGLLELDGKALKYEDGKLDIKDWVEYLSSNNSFVSKKENIQFFLEINRLSKKVDFRALEKERKFFIEELGKKLTKNELKIVIEKTLFLRLGKISAENYFKFIDSHLHHFKDSESIANLKRYSQLIKLQAKLDFQVLSDEIEEVEQMIRNNLYQNTTESDLDQTAKTVRILDKLYQLTLTRKELKYYHHNKTLLSLSAILKSVLTLAQKQKINIPSELNDKKLIDKVSQVNQPAQYFYKKALERDKILVKNLLEKMKKDHEDTAVIVVGGFHADGIIQELKDRQVSYITILPRITKIDEKSPYLNVMMNQFKNFNQSVGEVGIKNLSPVLALSELGKILTHWASRIAHDEIGRKSIEDLVAQYGGIDLKSIKELFKLAGIAFMSTMFLEKALLAGSVLDLKSEIMTITEYRIINTPDDLTASFLIEALKIANILRQRKGYRSLDIESVIQKRREKIIARSKVRDIKTPIDFSKDAAADQILEALNSLWAQHIYRGINMNVGDAWILFVGEFFEGYSLEAKFYLQRKIGDDQKKKDSLAELLSEVSKRKNIQDCYTAAYMWAIVLSQAFEVGVLIEEDEYTLHIHSDIPSEVKMGFTSSTTDRRTGIAIRTEGREALLDGDFSGIIFGLEDAGVKNNWMKGAKVFRDGWRKDGIVFPYIECQPESVAENKKRASIDKRPSDQNPLVGKSEITPVAVSKPSPKVQSTSWNKIFDAFIYVFIAVVGIVFVVILVLVLYILLKPAGNMSSISRFSEFPSSALASVLKGASKESKTPATIGDSRVYLFGEQNRDELVQDIQRTAKQILGANVIIDGKKVFKLLKEDKINKQIMLSDVIEAMPEGMNAQAVVALGLQLSQLASLQKVVGQDALNEGGSVICSILMEVVKGARRGVETKDLEVLSSQHRYCDVAA